MKEIPLSKRGKKHAGKFFAMVDDEDYDWLSQWNWTVYKSRNTHYAQRGVVEIEMDLIAKRQIFGLPLNLKIQKIKKDTVDQNILEYPFLYLKIKEKMVALESVKDGALKLSHH